MIASAGVMAAVYIGVCCGVPAVWPNGSSPAADAVHVGFLYCSPLPLLFLALKLSDLIEWFMARRRG